MTAITPDENHLREGYSTGAVDYIIKPYSPEIIISKVRVFLELARIRDELSQHRDHLEELVTQRTNELNQTVRELKRVNRIRMVLSEVNQSIFRIRDLKELLSRICQISFELGGFDGVIIWMFESGKHLLISKEARGLFSSEGSIKQLDPADPSQAESPPVRTFLSNKPVILNQNNQEKTIRNSHGKPDLLSTCSHGSFPISIDQNPVGVITFFTQHEGFFTVDEVALLEEMAMDVSFALKYMEEEKKRIQAEKKNEETERLKRAILGASPACIALFRNRKLEWCNELWETTFGYPMDDIAGKDSQIFFANETDYKTLGKHLYDELDYGEILEVETVNTRKDQSLFPCLVKATRLESEKREHLVIIVLHDITERKKNELELVKAKQKAEEGDRLKTAFLNNLSHEIRTPMNGIIGFSEILQDADITSDDRANFTRIIRRECHQLLRVINDIVEMARIETGQMDSFEAEINVNQMVTSLFQQYEAQAQEKAITLSVHCTLDEQQSVIWSDESKLKQILEKLVMNAIKFTHEGSIHFGYVKKENELEFYVEDTGIGIKSQNQTDIFTRFVQGEDSIAPTYGGTGLGLSIAKAFVEHCGGRIWLTSVPGEGTTFYFTIPYKHKKVLTTPKEPPAKKSRIAFEQNPVIFIVEDEVANFEYLKVLLELRDASVLHAENGEEAIRLFNEHPDINAVLMDIKLPDMSGFEVTREVKKIRGDVPVIAQTAYADSDTKRQAFEAGCIDFITKPINTDELMEKLVKVL